MTVLPADIAAAVAVLEAGGVVCFPTETTYGLAVDAANRAALAALTGLKGRVPDSPFGLIAGDAGGARALAATWPRLAGILAERHWPGPLTLVVPAASELADEITGRPAMDRFGSDRGVGVRVSSHPVAHVLARHLGRAITATSANPSGHPSARDVATARAYFAGSVTYLDDGPSPGERPSTVLAIAADGRSRLLRPGPIDIDPMTAN